VSNQTERVKDKKGKTNMSVLPGVETRRLHSRVLDQDLQLFIKLPWTYEQDDKTYPVLFALDANRSFPVYSTTSLIYETPGANSQEIVIVGIGYQVDPNRIRGLAQWAMWRTRDLTPVRREEAEQYWSRALAPILQNDHLDVQTGGAQRFLQSIHEEVVPFIESDYRVRQEDRGLAGYSYGGLFVLYALFCDPILFTRFFAGSPSMWNVLFEYEADYASKRNDLKASLLMTAGSRESETCERIAQMEERLRSRGYPGLEVQTHVFEGEGHMSAGAAAISRALGALYYPDMLNR
jgi:predicted alpha/beta superfamily hydrolase